MTRADPPGRKRSARARKPKAAVAEIQGPPLDIDAPVPAAPHVPDVQQFVHSAEGFWKAAGRFGRLR